MKNLHELEEAATPGPWFMWHIGVLKAQEHPGEVGRYFKTECWGPRYQEDAALIAAMRNALPYLLDVVDAAWDVHYNTENTLTAEAERLSAALAALDLHGKETK